MDTRLIVGAGAAAMMAGAALYFGGGAHAAAAANPAAAVVDGSPAEVIGILRAATLDGFVRHELAGGPLENMARRLTLKHEGGGIRDEQMALWYGGERVLRLVASVRPAGSRTEINVATELLPGALISRRELTAQDRTLMAALAARAASDFAASLAGGLPAPAPADQAHAVESAFGLDTRAQRAFDQRVRSALDRALKAPAASASALPPPPDLTAAVESNESFGQPSIGGASDAAPDEPGGAAPQPVDPAGDAPQPSSPPSQ